MSDPQEYLGSPVEFFGETFHLAPGEDYQWEMLEFADAAVGGADSGTLAGQAAVYRLLKAAIIDPEWSRFQATARRNKAEVQEHLMPIVVLAFTQKIERPTGRPSGSSAGPQLTPESSEVDSYSRVIAREEASGRADRAVMVQMAREGSQQA